MIDTVYHKLKGLGSGKCGKVLQTTSFVRDKNKKFTIPSKDVLCYTINVKDYP